MRRIFLATKVTSTGQKNSREQPRTQDSQMQTRSLKERAQDTKKGKKYNFSYLRRQNLAYIKNILYLCTEFQKGRRIVQILGDY